MRLDEYQWSHNPRGMHDRGTAARLDLARMMDMHMGWGKLVVLGADYLDLCEQMLKVNITPIVRIFRPHFGAAPPSDDLWSIWRTFYAHGVRWFEFYNEPNLGNEWAEGFGVDYRDIPNVIGPLMKNWLVWAEGMVAMGAYPGFPALAPAVGDVADAPSWMEAMMRFLADNYYERFRAVADNGLWCATHPYIYNHYYQQGSGVTIARDPGSQRAGEGGWRFEYPYDPITQADNPGLTAVSGGNGFSTGDPVGLISMGMAFTQKFQEYFGGLAVPVVGTEGGIIPVPTSPSDFQQADKRFPGFTWDSHAEATVAMFNWIAGGDCPPWMFGVTLWKEDDYLATGSGPVAAVRRLSESPPVTKTVQPLNALDEGPGPRGPKGPGPIHGSPDFHFLLMAPGFNADWFFGVGQSYWERFRPTLLTSVDYIGNLNYKKSLVVTILTTPDSADVISQDIKGRWPRVWIDMIATDKIDALAKVLNERAVSGRRFG